MNRMLQAACLHRSPSSCNWRKVPLIYLFNTTQVQVQVQVQVQTHGCSSCRVSEIFRDNVKVSTINRCSGFRTFCTGKDLASKKCVPCNSKDIRPMTEPAAMELIPKVPEWNLVNEDGTLKLNRTWKTKSFTKGLELFQKVGDIAEAEGHHPDLHLIGWNNVKIEIWTHSVGGLTENDFILAAKIDSLDLEHLLRRKAVK